MLTLRQQVVNSVALLYDSGGRAVIGCGVNLLTFQSDSIGIDTTLGNPPLRNGGPVSLVNIIVFNRSARGKNHARQFIIRVVEELIATPVRQFYRRDDVTR